MSQFQYYLGQFDYLARLATKDAALGAGDTGTGKSLMALSIIQLKLMDDQFRFTGRALIITPQGTLREDEEDHGVTSVSQWKQEVARFAPGVPVFEIYSPADYHTLMAEHGDLPSGIYLTYYEAMFRNGARESLPDSWDHTRLCQEFDIPPGRIRLEFVCAGSDGKEKTIAADDLLAGTGRDPFDVIVGEKIKGWTVADVLQVHVADYAEGVGHEENGIRCIVAPCLATVMTSGRKCPFDLIALDEAHVVANLDAQITQSLIRLQPRYRYAFTATPIPNVISNLFSIMGWLCVPQWHLGDRRNAAWPYTRNDLPRFDETFRSEERDYTYEEMQKAKSKKWRGKCVKISPVISSPARLLKLIKPTLAYISKPACNPAYLPPKIIDVRVPCGRQQAKLYAHFLDQKNISGNGLLRARKQIQYLRAITADPAGFEHSEHSEIPAVETNFNPKAVAVLELIRECLERGQQVVFISARVGLTDTIAGRLASAGIPHARIDSTIVPARHSGQANRFKRGEVPVMLMGLKCAAAHSFSQCPNLIIGAIEYSPGPFHQGKGRVDRVNSPVPPTIYCVLTKGTIEETMFDTTALKQDAATICLHGQRVPRDFKPVDMNEVITKGLINFEKAGEGMDESEAEARWPALQAALRRAWQPAKAQSAPKESATISPAPARKPKSKAVSIPVEIVSRPQPIVSPIPASVPVRLNIPAWVQRRAALPAWIRNRQRQLLAA
ncbi:MAG TPA: SNF2-related protein [Verrucomicrobiae bacterium]|nr:SNF2-related protein [Verrucomicrobiae bacterium]